MSVFRILLADDDPVFRLGLCSLLGSQEGWEICGEAVDGREAVEKCRQLRPDLVILDFCMPMLNGVDAARQILRDNPVQRGDPGLFWRRVFAGGFLSLTESCSEPTSVTTSIP